MSEFLNNAVNNVNICVLISEINPEQKFVLLNKQPLLLGRTPQTRIIDRRLSKNQLKFEADYSMGRVLVEQLGWNKSAVNKDSMIKGEKRLLYHGDIVSLLFNSNYTFRLKFLVPPSYGTKSEKRPNCMDEKITKKFCPNVQPKWETQDGTLLVYNSLNLVHKDKIAAFDMDGTIIVTQSGNVFPIDYNDWKINFPDTSKIIRTLSDNGYKIVIFTNQGGIGKHKVNEKSFKEKIENIFNVIETPVQVFVATCSDIYRKPAPGMWNTFVSNYNGDVLIDMNSSFFCGDAAGRPTRNDISGKQIKKDHSCCDRLFAMNIGLKFYTPEEYFWKVPTQYFKLPIFNPNDVMNNTKYTDSESNLLSFSKEMIIMVGSPGSGKSLFSSSKIGCHGRVQIISRDKHGTWQKCVSEAKKYLTSCSVVIDNTNPDKESRKRFIDVAKSFNVPCRVFIMNVIKEHAKHNNKYRELTNKKHKIISESIINLYFTKFEEPSKSEGIDEIVKINFVPNFNNSIQEKLYRMYLL